MDEANSSATPSNCGNTLKLHLPSRRGNTACGQGNDLGYGKNGEDGTMGNPQPSAKGFFYQRPMRAVQRLNGGGSGAQPGLRYSLSRPRGRPKMKACSSRSELGEL